MTPDRDLSRDLEAAETNHARLVSQAAALGTQPAARAMWELVHEAAGITAQLKSRHGLTAHQEGTQ